MIANDIYMAAYSDRANQGVMHAVSGRFADVLSEEEREEAHQMALVRCLGSFDPARHQKFTTSLHRFTFWECSRATRDAKRRRRRRTREIPLAAAGDLTAGVNPRQGDIEHVRECLGMMAPEDRRLIRQRFWDLMTFEEIAADRGCGRETCRGALERALGRLRRLCLGEGPVY